MKSASIREACQNLLELLDEVRKGREVVITERGRPVARLAAPQRESSGSFASHRRFRAGIRLRGKPLSATIAEQRGDRI